MINKLLQLINIIDKSNNSDDEYDAHFDIDEHEIAEKLFTKLRKELTKSILKYGYDTEYVICSSNDDYNILFIDSGISRIRTFNKLKYLFTLKTDYDIFYEKSPSSELYGVGDRIVLRKVL